MPRESTAATSSPAAPPRRGSTKVGSLQLALPRAFDSLATDRVAGPSRPAPGAAHSSVLPTPSGSHASTVALYPDVPTPRSAPSWASGTHLRVGAPSVPAGRPDDVVVATVDAPSWDALQHTDVVDRLAAASGRTVLSAPLLPQSGASLAQCNNGDYDQAFGVFASHISAADIQQPVVDIGAAMNVEGRSFGGDPAAFAACYRRAALAVKGAIPAAQLQWTVGVGSRAGMPRDAVLRAWPGADLVDLVGVQALDTRPWAEQINGDYGLNYWADFADRHGKRIAVSQWGAHPASPTSATNAAYVQNMHGWMARTAAKGALAYDAYTAPLDGHGQPADEAYRALFGRSR